MLSLELFNKLIIFVNGEKLLLFEKIYRLHWKNFRNHSFKPEIKV